MALMALAGCVVEETRIWRVVPLEIGGSPLSRGCEAEVVNMNTFESRFTYGKAKKMHLDSL